ncbi:MAG: D-tyrosyl-tRNA(Tyr) deacylase [Thermoleophilia bacterium]|jgi:D-tyrosyl-tRNA(Tyr) deacylase|nr:D-tyrosyl-tRNA(Tyr) deacylase [Thermoleophilia bacterium]
MRALVQRVSSARVSVAGRPISEIGAGMLVLLGVTHSDDEATAAKMAARLAKLRIFEDADGRINEPLGEREVLCVSQFTLYAEIAKGNRPSFTAAAPAERAEALYDAVCEALGASRGAFGAKMDVELLNDGPLTLMVEVEPNS